MWFPVSRRRLLLGTASALTAVSTGPLGALAGDKASPADTTPADAKPRVPYGAAVRSHALFREGDYQRTLIKYCQQVVPEGELKWSDLRPSPERYDFRQADYIIDFALKNGITPRGHTLAWYAALPKWAERLASPEEAERHLRSHIETVVGRYVGKIPSWDVVNEAMAEDARRYDQLRPSVWTALLGDRYIEMAFRMAAEVDPSCQLVINENDLAPTGEAREVRRQAFLDRLKRLKDRDVPVHAVGIQGHLRGDWAVDRDGLQRLVEGISALGLDLLITELDVIDHELPGNTAVRDRIVAEQTDAFLGAIFEVTRPKALLTWGITDRHTWVPIWFKRRDRQPNRPLPLDARLQPKPMMAVIERYCSGNA